MGYVWRMVELTNVSKFWFVRSRGRCIYRSIEERTVFELTDMKMWAVLVAGLSELRYFPSGNNRFGHPSLVRTHRSCDPFCSIKRRISANTQHLARFVLFTCTNTWLKCLTHVNSQFTCIGTRVNPGVLPSLWDIQGSWAHTFVFTKPSSPQQDLNQHFIRYSTYRNVENIFNYRFSFIIKGSPRTSIATVLHSRKVMKHLISEFSCLFVQSDQ